MRGLGHTVLTLALAVGAASPAMAFFPGGGRDAAKGNDCLIVLDGIDDDDVSLVGRKQVAECTDCDPACDLDGIDEVNGSCTFRLGACINQEGVAGCEPAVALTRAKATARVSGRPTLITLPSSLTGSACGAPVDLEVPLKRSGRKDGKGTAVLTALVKKNRAEGIPKRTDLDRVTYVCRPRPEGEACPPPPTTTTTTTSSTTTSIPLAVCGNDVLEAGEECDDGNPDPTDGCTKDCTICGNGTLTAPETCDDSNLVSGDGCDANCQPTGCGNGLLVAPETCDDGNTSDEDSCPADCIVDACTAQSGTDLVAEVNFAGSNDVAGITVFIDYPEGKVSIPGSGGSVSPGIITDLPGFAFGQTNDLDHALIQAVVDGSSFPAGLLFRIHFETCAGATPPAAGEFTCTVQSAGDPNLQPVPGVTCSVAVP
jgi:cysteine-rich repeat protein